MGENQEMVGSEMMRVYKVSIGVPVYNAAKYIERCARSIFEQSYEDLDIVFVDDCSPDNSADIIRKVLEEYPHRKEQTRIIFHEQNRGVAVARNTMLDTFQGEFFSFVDADDYLMADAIEKLVAKQEKEDSDIVTGKVRVQYADRIETMEEPHFQSSDEMLYHIVSQPANHYNWARIYRISVIRKNAIKYIEGMRMGEDWVFIANVALHVNIVSSIDDYIYTYVCTNEESAMHRLASSSVYAKYTLADTIVCHEIRKLILHKGQKYIDAVERMMAKRIESGLAVAYNTNDRETFFALKKFVGELSIRNVSNDYFLRKMMLCHCVYPEIYTIHRWIVNNILSYIRK